MTKNEAIQSAHHWQQRAEAAEKALACVPSEEEWARLKANDGVMLDLEAKLAVVSLRTQLADVTRERDQWAKKWKYSLDTYGENLIARGEEIDSLRRDRDVLMGQLGNTKIKLEAVTEERDRLREALVKCRDWSSKSCDLVTCAVGRLPPKS